MEALASGTPVVALRAGALPEIVEHGPATTGAVPAGTPRAVQTLDVTGPQQLRLEVVVRPEGTLRPGALLEPLLGLFFDEHVAALPLLIHRKTGLYFGGKDSVLGERPLLGRCRDDKG